MKTLDDVMTAAKHQLTRFGRLPPTILIDGTAASETAPLPQVDEALKLSVLEALGFTVAKENRVGKLLQLFLVAEGWRSRRNGPHKALRPEYDPDRVECVMVFCYQAEPEARQMALYDLVRNAAGEPTALALVAQPQSDAVESPPLEAVLRGFKRGWRRSNPEPTAA